MPKEQLCRSKSRHWNNKIFSEDTEIWLLFENLSFPVSRLGRGVCMATITIFGWCHYWWWLTTPGLKRIRVAPRRTGKWKHHKKRWRHTIHHQDIAENTTQPPLASTPCGDRCQEQKAIGKHLVDSRLKQKTCLLLNVLFCQSRESTYDRFLFNALQ